MTRASRSPEKRKEKNKKQKTKPVPQTTIIKTKATTTATTDENATKINCLCTCVIHFRTLLYCRLQNYQIIELSSWCCRHSLLINPDKTKLLYVGVPQFMRTLPAVLPSATMLVTEIKPVAVTKDLSVHIDCHLNLNEHITKTASDCIFKLTRVNRIKHLLDQKTVIYLMNAFVFSK